MHDDTAQRDDTLGYDFISLPEHTIFPREEYIALMRKLWTEEIKEHTRTTGADPRPASAATWRARDYVEFMDRHLAVQHPFVQQSWPAASLYETAPFFPRLKAR